MIALDAYYGGQLQLSEGLRESGPTAAILVEGLYALEFGTRVSVRVTTRGMPGDVTLEGTACPDETVERGATRIVIAHAHRARFEFLRDWARGVVRPVRAREDRIPIQRTPCMITLTTPVVRREAATLMEVSDHGACIGYHQPLSNGHILILELNVYGSIEHLAATVVWAHDGMAGLRLHRQSSVERTVWARVVSDHRRAFAWRVLTPANGPEVAASGGSDASSGRYAVVDRAAIERRRTTRNPLPTMPTMQTMPMIPSNRAIAATPEREPQRSAYPARRATLEWTPILPANGRVDADHSGGGSAGGTAATPNDRAGA